MNALSAAGLAMRETKTERKRGTDRESNHIVGLTGHRFASKAHSQEYAHECMNKHVCSSWACTTNRYPKDVL